MSNSHLTKGLLLEFVDNHKSPLSSIDEINQVLAKIGARIFSLDLHNEPNDIQNL